MFKPITQDLKIIYWFEAGGQYERSMVNHHDGLNQVGGQKKPSGKEFFLLVVWVKDFDCIKGKKP